MKDDEDAGTQSGADEDLDLMTVGCVHLTVDTYHCHTVPQPRENRKEYESLYNCTLYSSNRFLYLIVLSVVCQCHFGGLMEDEQCKCN